MSQFFGKYRGKVTNNIDPLQQGRLQVAVPSVLGLNVLAWALPCVPFAGNNVGFHMIPGIGANIWVEFEGGDPDRPIWVGCFWGDGNLLPAIPSTAYTKVIKTDACTLKLDDTPGIGGLTLEVGPPISATPLQIVMDVTGIKIVNGKNSIKLSIASVSVNDGALEVI
ncbi:MAG: baseplate assembly protein [Alphaproteobacteria bacterium]|nr:baseplate assembly protein [Alphaproteobacteria bacterium]